jgi:alkanesulfonate monooxygenase SsuD/methylene tetrahydromethanopterin reductase-like flavin-dependent oxidoreductase (luciferase family)
VAFNEHHVTPYGLMNSPNLLCASIAQRTSKLKLLMYGNLLPIHNPLRLAEEIAMLDCLSNGRVICGVARGAPREYKVFNIPLDESRARFDECYEIMRRAWAEESFSYEGKFHQFKNIAIWPRPVQQPMPVWVPVSRSKDSIEWAAANNIPITPGATGFGNTREDIIKYYATCLAGHGHKITPGHLNIQIDAYIADSREQAIKEYGPYVAYFHNVLFNFDHVRMNTVGGYLQKDSTAHLRPELQQAALDDSIRARDLTVDDIVKRAEAAAWGPADYVAKQIIEEAEKAGAETILVSMNRGAMPQDMFLNQIHRFGKEVLPRLQAHKITRVPYAEAALA